MDLLNPWALAGAAAVAVAAAIALLRPGREIVIVSTVRLWLRAIEATERGARRKRTLSASWLLLLAGALAAVGALADPVWRRRRPSRRVALSLIPCAELANAPGPDRLRGAAKALLNRLGRADRVQLVLPARLGGASALLSRQEALAQVATLEFPLVKAADLSIPPADPDAQHVYRIGPATLPGPTGPQTTNLALGTTTPAVTLDAVAAERLADGTDQLLVALKAHGPAVTAELRVAFNGAKEPPQTIKLDAGQRRAEPVPVPAGTTTIAVAVGAAIGQGAELTAVEAPAIRVAWLGRDNLYLRRFLGALGGVTRTGDVDEADAIVAVGADLPAGRAGIAFAPRTPPVGWQPGPPVGPLVLREAGILDGDGLLEHVELGPVVVAVARPFLPGPIAGGRRLVTLGPSAGGGTLVLAQPEARRVYVAFDPAGVNTNWGLEPSFPIFMANALAFLSPARPGVSWQPAGAAAGAIGLPAAEAPAPDIDAVVLPAPRTVGRDLALWPALAAAAAALWLLGWWRRLRPNAPGRRVRPVGADVPPAPAAGA